MEEYIVRVYEDRTEWWQHGKFHRTNGPARECDDGSKQWIQNGLLHRTVGPAVEYVDGHKDWWVEGKSYTEKEFSYLTFSPPLPVKELTERQVCELLGYEVKIVKE
jgi:hypothetical protein